jgi:ADP-ribose pyrophosphatase
LPYQTISTRTAYQGIICRVDIDEITLPNGKTGLREIDKRGGAAAVLPINADGDAVLVRQYRHTAKKNVLEIPAGMLDADEDPLACAARELEEETGFKSNDLTHMFSIYPSIGALDEIVHIYKAINLTDGKQNPDPEEFIEVEVYPIHKAVEMIFSGEIIDGKTIAAILAHYCVVSSTA